MRLLHLLLAIVVLPGLLVLAGCGGGGAGGDNEPATGGIDFTVTWPTRGRALPAAAETIIVYVGSDIRQLSRPADGSASTLHYTGLATGLRTYQAYAYARADATDTPIASAGGRVNVEPNAVAVVDLSPGMANTVTHLDITPVEPSGLIGDTVPLIATPKDALGRVVLVAEGNISWESAQVGVATVDEASGIATCRGVGSATLTATERESGATGATTLTVPIAKFMTWVVTGYVTNDVAVNPATNMLYATTVENDITVRVINGSQHTIAYTQTAGLGIRPWGIAVNPATSYAYVANTDNDTVSVMYCSGPYIGTTCSVPVGDRPQAVAVNATTNRVYVGNTDDDTVSVIDGATHTVAKTVAVGSYPVGIAVNEATNRVYVNCRDGVAVIDGSTDTLIDTIDTGTDANWGIAVNPATNRVYACKGNTLAVIDGATDAVLAALPVGTTLTDVVVHPGQNRIFVAVAGDQAVAVIDGATHALAGVVPVQSAPMGLAINPTTNRVYVVRQTSIAVIASP